MDVTNLNKITRAYTVGYPPDAEEVQQLRVACSGEKTVMVRGKKAMLTTAGLRAYVTDCIVRCIVQYSM